MLCGNMVKIITPDGDATIVICTKVEVVRLGSNNIWLEEGPRWSIAGMVHNYDIVCMQNYVIIPLVRFCDVLYIKLCIDHANIFINSSPENQKHTVGFPSFSFGLPPVPIGNRS
jgi:hypothetical protein